MLWWGERDSCRPGLGHTIRHEFRRGEGDAPDDAHAGWNQWYPDVGTPCDGCSAPWPGLDALSEAEQELVHHSGGTDSLYNTASGKPEPGDMFWNNWYPHENGNCPFNDWSNCDGRHLMVVLPNGHHWDVDSRANNCTLKVRDTPCPENAETGEHSDTCKCRTHRCWVRSGNPEEEPVTAGKSGPTCAAGAGSILAGDYHGFLQNGVLTAG